MTARRRTLGFTLVEAMVSVSILAVLALLGVPALSDTVNARRVQGAAQSLAATLRTAQGEAIRRNRSVEVIFTNDEPVAASVVGAAPVVASAARGWMARVVAPAGPADFVTGTALAGDFAAIALVNGTLASVGFTPSARPVDFSAGPGLAAPLAAPLVVRIGMAGTARVRCVSISSGGSVRVCDPSRPSGAVAACEPVLPPGAC
jgi:type IV fimbrial biogenesis protein FimT